MRSTGTSAALSPAEDKTQRFTISTFTADVSEGEDYIRLSGMLSAVQESKPFVIMTRVSPSPMRVASVVPFLETRF